ncbi:hypothetical protein [Kozakia baliensis]|uniref:hypothetical protein n=1 Tax=Kozakia baliensis TaxID=153496 RepID=UPI00049745F2|nr:hypothetical protein [Kozakia baliensis]
MRRSRRRNYENTESKKGEEQEICALCARAVPPHAKSSRHHLTPKLKGGAQGEVVRLHQVCHDAIHARYSEAEIAQNFSEVMSLRADPELARFVAWVRHKPDDFHAITRRARDKAGRRRGRSA